LLPGQARTCFVLNRISTRCREKPAEYSAIFLVINQQLNELIDIAGAIIFGCIAAYVE